MWIGVGQAAYAQEVDLVGLRARAEASTSAGDPGAVDAWTRLIEAESSAFGEGDPRVAATMTELARVLGRKDPVAARPWHERALAVREAALGPDHPDNAINRSGIGAACAAARDDACAIESFGRALAIREAALGPDHLDVAKSLENLARAHGSRHDHAAARPWWERAIALRERVQGPAHVDLAEAVGSYATCLWNLAAFDEATRQYERAIGMLSEVAGPEAPALSRHLSNFGVLLSDVGSFARAREVYARSLTLDEAARGPDHPSVAATLNNLGNVARNQGDYVYARACLERSLSIRRAAFGARHPDVARTLGNLAALEAQLGDLDRARSQLEEALGIRREVLGPDHPDVAVSEVSLGAVCWRLGDFMAARPLYEHALAVREATSGPDHPEVAQILNNLGSLLAEQGDYAVAREAFERALAIRERSLGPDHPSVAMSLSNLATLAEREGDRSVVGPIRERVLEIREGAFGPDHPELVGALTDLAAWRAHEGDGVGARVHALRALSIAERHLGPEHPDVATCWWQLGRLAALEHDASAARDAFGRALTIRERSLGPEHPLVGEALLGLATAAATLGDLDAARGLSDRARRIEQDRLALLDGLSEREGLVYMLRARPVLDGWLAAFDRPEDARAAWDAWLAWRGAVSRRVRDRQAGAWSDDADGSFAALDAVRRERVQNELTARTPETRDALDGRLRALVTDQERLERRLTEASGAWRAKRAVEHAGPDEVCAVIPEGSVLVDVVRFDAGDGSRYDAFLVTSASDVRRVPLAGGGVVDEALEAWLVALRDPAATTSRIDARGERVAAEVWAPLAPHLPAGEAVIVVPDGALAALPWSALPVGDGYLLERNPVTVLAEAQGLLGAAPSVVGTGAWALGGLEYGTGPGPSCGAGPLRALPGTADEVARLAAVWRRRADGAFGVSSGTSATEPAVRATLAGHALVHVATHGTYAASGCPSLSRSDDDAFIGLDPMLLSGVALSGGNAGGPADDDGWLTAREWAALDLRGTRWVVLSACETGLGVTTAGEGVQGLRRGVALAGAAQLVAALWAVPDAATAELMDAFYGHLLGRGSSGDAADALRAAQLDLLTDRRRAGEARPHDWGAFVVSGAGPSLVDP